MNRITFLVDGFNLYHSLIDAGNALNGQSTKWLNISSLCNSYLNMLGKNKLESIYYFTAIPEHYSDTEPGKIERQLKYNRCLESTEIIIIKGKFKSRHINCKVCQMDFIRHEEKETDVAIATKLLELAYSNLLDTAILVTGDTDLIPAVKCFQKHFPDKSILFAFPYNRKNEELKVLCPDSFRIRLPQYLKNQLTNPFVLSDGTKIEKPASW